jgi:hypothetical protein
MSAAYMQSLEAEKLSRLRAKTDRQLLDFLHSKLEAGLTFAEGSLEQGSWALNEVQKLLPVLNDNQRHELDPKLKQLREALDRLRGSPRAHTASSF